MANFDDQNQQDVILNRKNERIPRPAQAGLRGSSILHAPCELPNAYLKKTIVSDQGVARHQPAGILECFEEQMRGFDVDMEPKDFFEAGSNCSIVAGSESMRQKHTF